MEKNSKAVEDYLESVLILQEKNLPPSITNIANELHVSKPAATQMASELKVKGYISKARYGELALTPVGEEVAAAVYHRHKVLRTYLESIGVAPFIAEVDCCQIEHVISEETFKAIEAQIKKD
jgi:DtxR family transcriptional regulator, Mn-dependent transcriptional regulator